MRDEVVDHITDTLPTEERDETIFTSNTGLKLKLRKVNSRIFYDAAQKVPRPRPPIIKRDSGFEEENISDPTYQEALARFNFRQQEVVFNLTFLLGTEIIFKPDDMEPIESDNWSELIKDSLAEAGIEMDIAKDGNRRRLAWLKYYAIPSEDEQAQIMTRVMELGGGILAEKVAEAMDSFRDLQERDTNNGVQSTAENSSGPGDNVGASILNP